MLIDPIFMTINSVFICLHAVMMLYLSVGFCFNITKRLLCVKLRQFSIIASQNTIFILEVPFKVTLLRCNTILQAFFPTVETLLMRAFQFHQQLLFRVFFYLLNRSKNTFLSSVSAVLGRGKSQSVPSCAQASMCELVRYYDAKSMIGFSTILYVSNVLLRAIGAYLRDGIP